MKCQNLFSGKNISVCHLLKILPWLLSVKSKFCVYSSFRHLLWWNKYILQPVSVLALKGLGVRDPQKLPWDFQKSMPGSLGLPTLKIFSLLQTYNKNLEWFYVLFSLRMVGLLHKWEFKNTEVEFLKVSEKIWSPGLPDIGARMSWDFLILSVSAVTGVLILTTSHDTWCPHSCMAVQKVPYPAPLCP